IKHLGIGEKTLSKEVKLLTGKTPKLYIDERLTLEAKRLLSYSLLTVKEICFELGFDEPTNFGKFFKKQTGITPVAFRKKYTYK
ncbi:MAG: helix-turn-helix domain-containing protein, partial [Odoribacter sp.]|nr:helix-turn-helix domain-containing protein [Odoribacter sp.]